MSYHGRRTPVCGAKRRHGCLGVATYSTRLLSVEDTIAALRALRIVNAGGARSDVPVEAGVGRIDLRGLLKTLLEIDDDGVVTYEYEKGGGNPVIGRGGIARLRAWHSRHAGGEVSA